MWEYARAPPIDRPACPSAVSHFSFHPVLRPLGSEKVRDNIKVKRTLGIVNLMDHRLTWRQHIAVMIFFEYPILYNFTVC
jgi:hypothetical protein